MNAVRSGPSRLAAAVVLALTLGLAACAADDASTANGSSGDSGGDVQPLALTAATTDGGQFEFGSLEGQDAVLWFWAPW